MTTSFKSAGPILLAVAIFFSTGATLAAPTAHFAKTGASTNAVQAASANSARAKTKKHVHHVASAAARRGKAWLIPPPPAYMPNVLPELLGRQSAPVVEHESEVAEDGELKTPENPYKKYIHTPDGFAPQPVQTRKGVTTWTQRS